MLQQRVQHKVQQFKAMVRSLLQHKAQRIEKYQAKSYV